MSGCGIMDLGQPALPTRLLQSIRAAALDRRAGALAALPRDAGLESVRQFVDSSRLLGPLDHYKRFGPATRRIVGEVAALGGPEAVKPFLEAAVMQGVLDLLDSGELAGLPPRTRHHHVRQLQRVASKTSDADAWTGIDADLFQKDFGIATLRLYAAAAQLVDRRGCIPRSVLFRGGLPNVPVRALQVLRLGGFKPYLQIHTHVAYLDEFNEAGRIEAYLTCCELFERHPQALGMLGSSWYYDPVVERISPRLRYLRQVPVSGGASCWLVATDGDFVNDAIATSPTRRRLYEEGRYHPRGHMLVWGKNDLRKWARRAASLPQPLADLD